MTTDDTDFDMPMDDQPLPSDSLLGLIQPYIADELPPAERARVDARLAEDPQLRDMVAEQCAIRQDLRDMSPEAAPQALRARVLLELDSVDRERASERPAVQQPGPWQRLRALFRGAAVMVPASATAVALFLFVRTDAPSAEVAAVAEVATASAPIVVGRDNGAVHPAVRLVGASVDAAPSPAIRTLAVGDRRVLDRQDPAGGLVPGNAREFRGQRFWLGHLGDRPAVAFEVGGVRHTLTAADGPRLRDDLEFLFLLEIGDQLRAASRR